MAKLIKLSSVGNPDTIVANDGTLAFIWESIQTWIDEIVAEAEGHRQRTLIRVRAGLLLLACKVFLQRLEKLHAENSNLPSSRLNQKRQAILKTYRDLNGLQVVKEMFEHEQQSSVEEASGKAKLLLEAMKKAKSDWKSTTDVPLKELRWLEGAWRLLKEARDVDPNAKSLPSREIKKAQQWLSGQCKSTLAVMVQAEQTTSTASPPPKRPRVDIRAALELNGEEEKRIGRYLPTIGLVPTEGPVASPRSITAKDLVHLASLTDWLTDNTIDAYLALICHSINGHFGSDQRSTTPMWHAWSIRLLETLQGAATGEQFWPINQYPEAVAGEIKLNFFPVHLAPDDGRKVLNHLALIVVWSDAGSWIAEGFSSLLGYEQSFRKAWSLIRHFLVSLQMNLDGVELAIPRDQPTQKIDSDCGVIVCGLVRWAYEGWELSDLTPDITRVLRHRILYELECWSLTS